MLSPGPHCIKRMNPTHWKILRLYLKGISNAAIAEQVQMVPSSVSLVINSPIFQFEYEKKKTELDANDMQSQTMHEAEALDQLRLQTRAAVKRITQGMKSDNENIAVKCAESILDRTGLGKVTKNETHITGQPLMEMNVETLALIKQTLELDHD